MNEVLENRTCQEKNHNKGLCIPVNEQTTPHSGGIGMALFEAMKENGDGISQIDAETGRTITYKELLKKSILIAQNLQRFGVQQGDAVTFCTMNNLDCYPTYIASMFLGVIASALDPVLSIDDSAKLLKVINPKVLYCDEAGLELMKAVLLKTETKPEIIFFGETEEYIPFRSLLDEKYHNEEFFPKKAKNIFDTALIFFTSGTTDISKCIAISHFAILYIAMQNMEKTVLFWMSRMCWISSSILLFKAVLSGSSWIMCTEEPSNILTILKKYKVEIVILSISSLYKLIKNTELKTVNLEHLKLILTIGGKVASSQIPLLKKLLPNVIAFNGYGLTELVSGMCTFSTKDVEFLSSKPTSCGKLLKGMCAKVVDLETNKILGPNEPGEVRIKSVSRMNEYYNNLEATNEASDEDGYFRTGDIMYYDEDYCFHYVERLKNIMKFRSFYVIPNELESILLEHPSVAEAVVISTPNEEDGDHPTAVVKLLNRDDKVVEDDIRKFVDEKVVDYKRLRGGVYIVDEIPKTATSKLSRRLVEKSIFQKIKQ